MSDKVKLMVQQQAYDAQKNLIVRLTKERVRMTDLMSLAQELYIEKHSDGETDCPTPFDNYVFQDDEWSEE